MKNKLTDLMDHLFAQLERVNDEGIEGDALRTEIARAGAVSSLASQVIAAGTLAVTADRLRAEYGHSAALSPQAPRLLGLDSRT